MKAVRRLGQVLMSGIFVVSGIDTWRNPGAHRAEAASQVIPIVTKFGLPEEPEQLVRINSVVHIVGGLMLAKGLLPRLSALSLAASLVPTTYGAHRFWELTDKRDRAMQRTQFLKNTAMFGGLLMAAAQPRRRAHKTKGSRSSAPGT